MPTILGNWFQLAEKPFLCFSVSRIFCPFFSIFIYLVSNLYGKRGAQEQELHALPTEPGSPRIFCFLNLSFFVMNLFGNLRLVYSTEGKSSLFTSE